MSIKDMLRAARAINDSNVGYDQGDRWSFYDRTTRTIRPNGECDCSSSCGAIAHAAGYPVNLADPFWTGNFKDRLTKAGFSAINVLGWTSHKLFTSVKPGDFLLGPGHVIFVENALSWWSAESDERGRKSGGRTGDQGIEARFRRPYVRSRGWHWILRPPAEASATTYTVKAGDTLGAIATKFGKTVADLAAWNGLQNPDRIEVGQVLRLTPGGPQKPAQPRQEAKADLAVDGKLGPKTIRAVQRWVGATEDGIWGSQTTRKLQYKVGTRVDGIRGPKTIKALQRLVGARQDGVIGPDTVRKLQTYLNAIGV